MRRIAISDIHGCPRTLTALLDQKVQITRHDELYFLGDYIVRGPDSRGVLNLLCNLYDSGYNVRCLLGNHEARILQEAEAGNRRMEEKFMRLLSRMEYIIETDIAVMVHAGINLDIVDPSSDTDYVLLKTTDRRQLPHWWLGSRIIMHGHQKNKKQDIIRAVAAHEQIVGIDNGCYAVGREGMGNLCAFDFENRTLFFQKNLDMK